MPDKNDLVLVFDDKQLQHKLLFGKIIEMILSNGGQIRGSKILLGKTQDVIDRPVNILYPVETNFQFVLKDNRQGSAQIDDTNTRPKQNAGDLAKFRIKYASGIT